MMRTAFSFITCLSSVFAVSAALGQNQPPPLVPVTVELSEAAARAIGAPWLTDEEAAQLRVFHGVWEADDLRSPALQAMVALNAWDLDHPSLVDPQTPVELQAEALLRRGELREAVNLLADVQSIHGSRLRAEALEMLGEHERASRIVDRPTRRLMLQQTDSAHELTEGVRALLVRSRIDGQPARDFQTMLSLLGRAHQELDRLYWPALLTEGLLLDDKDDVREAVSALHQALALNPRNAETWYALGRIALGRFDFASANRAADHLRELNAEHPLAELLQAEASLVQDDPDAAVQTLQPLLDRLPKLREAHALYAAAQAILYDEQAMRQALQRYEELSPGSARAHYVVGRQLSFNRQYEAAAEMLEEAVRRQPNWPAPQIELGLMELQSGRDANARHALQEVAQLDPFNKRAANSLFLLEELADYQRLETEHFIVRYRPGVDQVMVEMMAQPLEQIHRTVSERFQFEPDRKTVIELMPDHQRFAVRITGMPFVHTIAACTGPVIAMEVPREGSRHTGLYDWPRVLQHEYTHTITLAQTRNRIPHWLTEAAAVEMERSPMAYTTCVMLARSLQEGTLFDLDEIKWAFVRPKQPGDRSKAYAQGYWMLQYMNDRFGESAVIRLFERYFDGEREHQAMPNALGVSREEFFDGFLAWAERQVAQWGMAASPTVHELTEQLRRSDPELVEAMNAAQQANLDAIAQGAADRIGRPGVREPWRAEHWPRLRLPRVEVTDEILDTWMAEHQDHPDLAELKLRRALRDGADEPVIVSLLERYAELRPVDPFPHQQLAQLHLASGDMERAAVHLEYLDAREEQSPVYAVHLAHHYRAAGDLDAALAKATRALHIDPYRAANRELAAAIAVESRKFDVAEQHIEALTLLEPDRPHHQRRLEAVRRLR